MKSVDQYVELMNNLKLANPQMMDVAVPANMKVGLAQEDIARRGWAVSAAEAVALTGRSDVAMVDLRERTEREKHGVIAGSLISIAVGLVILFAETSRTIARG